ncbi:MAG: hypothetical protein ACQ9MH_03440 [Nitrospinales bacterium]
MKKTMLSTLLFLYFAGSAMAMPQKITGTTDTIPQFHNEIILKDSIPVHNTQGLVSYHEAFLIAKGPKHKDHPHGKGKHKAKKHHKKHKKHHKHHPFAGSSLPAWAHDCGLPPGLAKQNKVPPGWERKCKAGYKYYDHEAEFREEVYRGQTGPITQSSPVYKTIYEMDDSDCKVKSITSAGDIAVGVAKGAVFGGLIGAAGGAIYGATTDANTADSTITGAAGGAVLGGILASNDYKSRYRKCMRNRGHQVN